MLPILNVDEFLKKKDEQLDIDNMEELYEHIRERYIIYYYLILKIQY